LPLASVSAPSIEIRGIVAKRLGSRYWSRRSPDWLKFKNPKAPAVRRESEEDYDWLKFKNPEAPAVKREAEEDWGR
jgi:hypothetical protein